MHLMKPDCSKFIKSVYEKFEDLTVGNNLICTSEAILFPSKEEEKKTKKKTAEI